VVLLDTCDIRRVARPGLTTIAWVRNWGERWLAHPWFEEFDVVLASSRRMAERIAASSRHRPVVFPLATNPDRFTPGDGRRHGVVLALNHFGDDRGAVDLAATVADLELYGKGWDTVPEVVDRWKGHLPYEELPALYGRAEVVLDRAGHHTKQDASVNARVFDALAAGAIVVTDQHDGAQELFGGALPAADLDTVGDLIARLRADPETPDRQRRLREVVVAHHSYAQRARTLQQLLVDRARRPAVDLWIGAPDLRAAERWGDLHLAEAFARELRLRGCRTTVRAQDGWGGRAARTADVVIQLKGRGTSSPTEGSLHVLWVISHPDEVTEEECDRADLVLVASERFAAELRHRTSSRVEVLLQATDERRFSPQPRSERYRHDLAFVGNSKFSHRPAVDAAVAAGLDLAIYGDNWDGYAPARLVRARHVPNEELPELYSSVTLLLNDHWADMRRWGFVSNRCYDALACGAVMVSDHLDELDTQLDGAVATFDGPDDLAAVVRELSSDPDERRRRAERGRAAVLARHTFAHRADELVGLLEPELRARGLQVGDRADGVAASTADRPAGPV
jgi:O-antigen biosynthesis protein